LGALITRLLLVILFTGPINEMPPALNATGWVVGDDWGVAIGVTWVVEVDVVVVTVDPVVGCPLFVPVPAHAVSKNTRATTAVHTNKPWK
jgi:hypothetical protein